MTKAGDAIYVDNVEPYINSSRARLDESPFFYVRWVDCAERLPGHDGRVLIVYRSKHGKRSMHVARYSGGEWRFIDKPPKRVMTPERVTHWMEEPALPRRSNRRRTQ
jgi:hypothetical protein